MWWFPIQDPDSVSTMGAAFDRNVPKDTSANAMDLDVVASDVTPFYEPGGVTWEDVLDIGAQPRKLYAEAFMSGITFNSVQNRDPATPFEYEFWAGLQLQPRLKRPVRTREPGLICIAIASPDTTLTSATEAVAGPLESDWGQLQFIDHVIERAHMSLLGLTETGAEIPWENAATLIRRHLAPLLLELDAGIFTPITWSVVGSGNFVVDVQGTMPKKTINPAQV